MADVVDDIRPVAELLDTLRSEGVRADNRDRLRRQLEDLRAAIKQFSALDNQSRGWGHSDQQSQQAFDTVREQLHFAREARQFLEESIVAAETFVSMRLAVDASPRQQTGEQQEQANSILRARPVEGEIDYAELSREHIARYPKIRARLAE